jgi:hypothetical protein
MGSKITVAAAILMAVVMGFYVGVYNTSSKHGLDHSFLGKCVALPVLPHLPKLIVSINKVVEKDGTRFFLTFPHIKNVFKPILIDYQRFSMAVMSGAATLEECPPQRVQRQIRQPRKSNPPI